MQKLLRKAATTLYSQGQLDFDSMHNYLMSGEILDLDKGRSKRTIKLTFNLFH